MHSHSQLIYLTSITVKQLILMYMKIKTRNLVTFNKNAGKKKQRLAVGMDDHDPMTFISLVKGHAAKS